MATLVSFHAHPDDEAILTAGTMAKAAAQGHRVVLVVATAGENGEVDDGVLTGGETLGERRREETRQAAQILGVHRVEFLGYRDSGMMGEPTNDAPGCFWQADLDEAAGRLARILDEERADVLTGYDDHGGYGHPDHIRVHEVSLWAAAKAGVGRVYAATMNRDLVRTGMQLLAESVPAAGEMVFPDDFGTPHDQLTTAVDVSAYLNQKRAAMAAHASQIGPESLFLSVPAEMYPLAFGTEWFVRLDTPVPPLSEAELFEVGNPAR